MSNSDSNPTVFLSKFASTETGDSLTTKIESGGRMAPLPLDVRRTAMASGGTEIYLNETSRVISFRFPGKHKCGRGHATILPPGNKMYCSNIFHITHTVEGGTRVNVYYTTGTVGTCLDHPRQVSTRTSHLCDSASKQAILIVLLL